MSTAIAPETIANRLEQDDEPYLLDVRRQEDYEDWHLDGAVNLDIYDELLDGTYDGLAAAMDDLPADREIVTICVAGVTSARAAAFLQEHGYEARSMEDGMRGWGRVYRSHETQVEGVIQIVRPGTGCVSYLVADDDEAIVVDPGLDVERYRELARARGLTLIGSVDTHAHADHISGGPRLVEEDIPYHIHPEDMGSRDDVEPLREGDEIRIGSSILSVWHTPGHTPGSLCLRFGNGLLSGDTLFLDSVGRPDLDSDDAATVQAAARQLFESLDRLWELPPETVILPGHTSDSTERPISTSLSGLRSSNALATLSNKERFVDRVTAGLSSTPPNYQRIKAINRGRSSLTEDAADLELGPNNCAAN